MAFCICCFFCIIIGWNAPTANAAPTFIPQDTSRPSPSGVVKIKELPKKKRSKQVQIKERPPRTKKVKTTTSKATPKNKNVHPSKVSTSSKTAPTPKTTVKKERSNTTPKPPKNATEQLLFLTPEEELRLLVAAAKVVDTTEQLPIAPLEQCAFAFDHIDEFTGTRKRGLAPRLFFSYTPEQYRKFLKTDDFISCEGYLSQSSKGGIALNIRLSVASPAAKKKFGDLPPNSSLTLKTMQGKDFLLKTYQGAKAVIKGGHTVYECSFVIDSRDVKKLAQAEIDQTRLRFANGFQQYEVYHLDFLKEQFPCFE